MKILVKGFVAGTAAAAVVAAAAGAVTSVATTASPVGPAVQPVVFDVPLPAAPAPELRASLTQTLSGAVGPGSYTGTRGTYIEGGLGRIESRAADSKYNQKAAQGYFPLSFVVSDVDLNGNVATANVTATAATGQTAPPQPLTFVQGPSPTGWQVSKASALAVMSSLS